MSAGARFRNALSEEKPLQIVGAINAYAALQATQAGFRALYLSGAGVANASYGMPDLGMTSLADVLVDARRITSVVETPLLVDIDTGWGSALGIARTIREMIRAGVAAVHMEDQVAEKRCGHRPGKAVVKTEEMVDRIHAAVDARFDEGFALMARTDAVAIEGVDAAIDRANRYVDAGADMIFAEALSSVDDFQKFTSHVNVPVLANMTEFGKTPMLKLQQFRDSGVAMVLYPLSAFRAMSRAAEATYKHLRSQGDLSDRLEGMQTRDELYQTLNYHEYEAVIDRVLEGRIDE